MKIVIASDSFKGSISSFEASEHIEIGIREVFNDAQVIKLPIADGGEGTVDAFITGAGGEKYSKDVTGPLGEKVNASFGILENGIGVIEMAEASGLTLVSLEKRNPSITTTYGVGELILEVLEKGCREIIIGIGGSSTNDGGVGMAQALGVSFKDKLGRELPFGGGAIRSLSEIDISGIDKRLSETNIIIASDVTNPLCGEKGASMVFGGQKGANAQMMKTLDENLLHLSNIVKRQLNIDMSDNPGSGAAGGLGYGLMVFLNGKFKNGIETVLNTIDFSKHLKDCDLVITGEGKIDGQSIYGKVPVGVAKYAKQFNIPVLAIVGNIGADSEAVYDYGIDSIISTVNGIMTLDEAVDNGKELIEDAAKRALKMIKIGMGMKK